jgi:hypothetical protein
VFQTYFFIKYLLPKILLINILYIFPFNLNFLKMVCNFCLDQRYHIGLIAYIPGFITWYSLNWPVILHQNLVFLISILIYYNMGEGPLLSYPTLIKPNIAGT